MDLSSAQIFVCFLILFVAGVAKIGRSRVDQRGGDVPQLCAVATLQKITLVNYCVI